MQPAVATTPPGLPNAVRWDPILRLRQALCVVLVEYLAVALVAAAIGIIAGTLLSPLIGRDLPVLYGAPVAPPITWPRALVALAVAMAVVVAGSVPPAIHGVRQSTVRALAAGARPPRHASRAARLAAIAGAPLPAVFGLRSALRRPVRTVANATGLAMGVALVILGLGASKLVRDYLASPARDDEEAVARSVIAIQADQVLTIALIGAGLLIGLAAVNAMIAAIFAARQRPRLRDPARGRCHATADRDLLCRGLVPAARLARRRVAPVLAFDE